MKMSLMAAIMSAALGTVGSVGVAAASDADDRVENTVETKLDHDAHFKGAKLKVDVDNGVAKLKGKVASEAERARAERLVAACEGVVRVDNQLEIDSSVAKDRLETSADHTKDTIDENARRTKDR